MFSTDFIFSQQENLVDNQKCQAGFRPLCNKILCFCNGQKNEGSYLSICVTNDEKDFTFDKTKEQQKDC